MLNIIYFRKNLKFLFKVCEYASKHAFFYFIKWVHIQFFELKLLTNCIKYCTTPL